MQFSIESGHDFKIVVKTNPEKTLKIISEALPGEVVWLFACNRGRMAYLDGELHEDHPSIDEFFDLNEFPEKLARAIRQEWRDLLTGKITSFPQAVEASPEEMWPDDPLKWNAYRQLRVSNAEEPDMDFYMNGEILNVEQGFL